MWDDYEIVTLEQGKAHLRLGTSTDQDEDLTLKLAQAHALVLDYIYMSLSSTDTARLAEMATWAGSPDNAPRAVQAAIMRQFAELVRFRGDDDDPSEIRVNGKDLSPRVTQFLIMYKKPALA